MQMAFMLLDVMSLTRKLLVALILCLGTCITDKAAVQVSDRGIEMVALAAPRAGGCSLSDTGAPLHAVRLPLLRLRGAGGGFRDLYKASSLTGYASGHEREVLAGGATKNKRRKWWRYTFKPRRPRIEPVLHAVDWSGSKEPRDWDDAACIEGGWATGSNSTALVVANEVGLLRCARFDDSRGVRSMVKKHGVDVNARDPACGGATALHIAAGRGHIGPVKRLLRYGADPNAKNEDDHTAVHWAASMGHAAVVQRLARAGATLTCKTKKLEITPVQTALANGHAKVAEMIEDMIARNEKQLRRA